jgi:tripartite-type tricarboxylate transporter receptor subunit TctC
MEFTRTTFVRCIGGLLMAAMAPLALAADYPDKPVKLIVGYPPGGTTDVLARLVGTQLQMHLKQPFVVENRPGAGGGLGAGAVARAAADGYTLGLGTAGNLALNYAVYPEVPYDSLKQMTPLSLIATVPNVLVVNAKVPARTVAELIAHVKSRPKGSFFASTGAGNGPHLTGELFKARTGLNLSHVPYQGSAPALTAVLAGDDVEMLFDNLPTVLPHIQSGKLRAIAVSSAKRNPSLPEVPTMQESGLTDFVVDAWFALVGPAGMSKDATDALDKAIAALAADKTFLESVSKLGAVPELSKGADLRKLIELERQRWPTLVKQANLKF